MENYKIAETVAVPELRDFISYHLDKEIEDTDVLNEYDDILKAVMRGNFNISDYDKPVLFLRKPISDEKGEIVFADIHFVTRVLPSETAMLARGMDMQKDAVKFTQKITAHLCGFAVTGYLDKLSKSDYRLVTNIAMLFQ